MGWPTQVFTWAKKHPRLGTIVIVVVLIVGGVDFLDTLTERIGATGGQVKDAVTTLGNEVAGLKSELESTREGFRSEVGTLRTEVAQLRRVVESMAPDNSPGGPDE